MIPARGSCRYGDGSDFKNGLRKNVGLDLGRRLLVVLKTAKVDETQAIRVVDHGEQQKEALRRLYDAQVLLQSYEDQLCSKDEQLQSIMACVKKAIRQTNGDAFRDPVLVRSLGLSEEELQERIVTMEQKGGGRLARFDARPDQAFENQKWEEQQDRDRKAREMQEVTGGLSTPASPQNGGPEHELNWFKIPYWLKGDEETRAIVHNMKQHFIDEMNAKGHFDHNMFQEHLWQCGLQVAQRWAGVPNQELIKQAEAAEQKARQIQRESLQETSMLRQHIKRVERKYKELQGNVGKMQKAMSTMASQLMEAREALAMYDVELSPPHEAERRPSVGFPLLQECSGKVALHHFVDIFTWFKLKSERDQLFGRMDRQDLLETPTYVRLKFFAEGRDFEKAPPIRGSFKDVQIKSRTIEELSEAVVQWLGSPGAWQLATVCNWPLTPEALLRPTTLRCPLVVHVWNSQEKLAEDVKNLGDTLMKFREDLERRLKDMNGETDKKVKSVEDQVRRAEEYINQTFQISGNYVNVNHKTQAGSIRRQFVGVQALIVIMLNLALAVGIGYESFAAYQKAWAVDIPRMELGLELMGSGASRKPQRPADLDWWYSTPLEYGFQGPLLISESSVAFPRKELDEKIAKQGLEETQVPEDNGHLDAEEDTFFPEYASFELLSERMRQRVAALEAALQQLEPNRREVEYDDETRQTLLDDAADSAEDPRDTSESEHAEHAEQMAGLEETQVPEDNGHLDAEEDTFFPEYASFELLSERMRQRVAALEAALQQLEPNRREVEYDDETRQTLLDDAADSAEVLVEMVIGRTWNSIVGICVRKL
eukprot:symbB.v1.2.039326.t1/scaffold6490.1/size17659/1